MSRAWCVRVTVEAEVMIKFFAAHDWEKVQELYARGWSNPLKFYKWPSAQMPDYLATYFGMQVAYFFHFYNSFMKSRGLA